MSVPANVRNLKRFLESYTGILDGEFILSKYVLLGHQLQDSACPIAKKLRNMLWAEFDTHKQACRFALGKVAFPREQIQICCLLGQH